MSLKNCGAYLSRALTTVYCESESPNFDRSYEQRATLSRHGLPPFSSAEPIVLADFENWVEDMLDNLLRDRPASARSCNLLARLLHEYSENAMQMYAGCPNLMSEVLLTLLDVGAVGGDRQDMYQH
jgi:hypothetical protein